MGASSRSLGIHFGAPAQFRGWPGRSKSRLGAQLSSPAQFRGQPGRSKSQFSCTAPSASAVQGVAWALQVAVQVYSFERQRSLGGGLGAPSRSLRIQLRAPAQCRVQPGRSKSQFRCTAPSASAV